MGEAPQLHPAKPLSLEENTRLAGEGPVDLVSAAHDYSVFVPALPALKKSPSPVSCLDLIEAISSSFSAIRRMSEDVGKAYARMQVLIVPEAQQSSQAPTAGAAEGSAIADAAGGLATEDELGQCALPCWMPTGMKPSRLALTTTCLPTNAHSSVWSLGLLQ